MSYRDWFSCQLEVEGDVVSWDKATLNITGLEISHLEKQRTCTSDRDSLTGVFTTFKTKRNFDETVKFCANIGGRIGGAETHHTLTSILPAFSETCGAGETFYTGYTDREREGRWVDVTSGQQMKSHIDWAERNPSGKNGYDCQQVSSGGQMSDSLCTVLRCPVCRMPRPATVLRLGGVCPHSNIDRYFVVRSEVEFLGYIHTKGSVQSIKDKK